MLQAQNQTERISIHALREEGDADLPVLLQLQTISIHALREEGDVHSRSHFGNVFQISIHALREEGDFILFTYFIAPSYFYPRPPRGGRRLSKLAECVLDKISIHALREEGDSVFSFQLFEESDFYPRPPRGGRLELLAETMVEVQFLSTPSARRATLSGRIGAAKG